MGEPMESKSLTTIKPPSSQSTQAGQYLTFALNGETYAIGILNVKEIIDFGDLTEVPMMPSFIKGVINLRGRVVPVIDLTARFGHGVTQIAKRTSVIIVEIDDTAAGENGEMLQNIGIMVDAVNEVVDIAQDEIEPPPSFGTRIRADFISGMAKRNSKFMILLAADQVLSIEEMVNIGHPPHTNGVLG